MVAAWLGAIGAWVTVVGAVVAGHVRTQVRLSKIEDQLARICTQQSDIMSAMWLQAGIATVPGGAARRQA